MTKEEIIEMLRASCDKDRVDPEQNGFWVIVTEELEAFAKLVAEKEREFYMQLFLDPENQPTQFGTATQEYREQEIRAEREACAKVCDLAMLQNQEAINELEEDEHIAQCFIQGAMTQLVKTSKAIRARGQE